jgi:hypothetical protein
MVIDAQYIDTVIDAKLAAKAFVGLQVKPREDGTFDVCHWHPATQDYNRTGVALAHLVPAVNDLVEELQESFGLSGEKLLDLPMHIELIEPTRSE